MSENNWIKQQMNDINALTCISECLHAFVNVAELIEMGNVRQANIKHQFSNK